MPPLKAGAQLASVTNLAIPDSMGTSLMGWRGKRTGSVVQNQSLYLRIHWVGSHGPKWRDKGGRAAS